MRRLAIISTHPIQYNAPFFKALNASKDITVKVFYTWEQSHEAIYDPGFGQERKWDIPLLDGYEYEFIRNIARSPGSHNFFGIINTGLIKKIKQWQPDAILVYGWAFLSHLRVIKYFHLRIPVYFRGDSTLLDEQKGIKTFLRRRFLKWVYRSIDRALYVGKRNYEYYRVHNVAERKLVFVPHTVDNERLVATIKDELFTEIKEKLKGKTTFLFAGKLEAKKDPLLLLNAFNKLPATNAALLYVGSGVLENELKRKAAGNENIHFLPFQNQSSIAAVYRLADVLVLPSAYNETWGLAVNEAMCCGLVPITSDKVGCAADLVENGVNGYVFSSGSVDELCAKMKNILDPSLLQNFKNESLKKITGFSIAANVLRLEAVLSAPTLI